MDIIRNPIFLALVAGAGTYYYLYQENEKLHKKNPKSPKEDVDYTIPAVVAIIVLFIAYSYFGNGSDDVDISSDNSNSIAMNSHLRLPAKLAGGSGVIGGVGTDTLGSQTYHLIGKNSIKLPHPDVFIDMAKF